MGKVISTVAFPLPCREKAVQRQLALSPNLVWLQTVSAGKTPALHFEHAMAKWTLLVIHGNAEDISQAQSSLQKMSNYLCASVFAVEYPGYSISEASSPREYLCYEAADAAYAHLTTVLRVPPEHIVPYGRSMGTGPAVHLASSYPEIKRMVLISPLESGARAAFGRFASVVGYPLDIFKNYRKIGHVQARTCIIHGKADKVVPIENGLRLHRSLCERGKAAPPLWLEGYGHNDMPTSEILSHVKAFLHASDNEATVKCFGCKCFEPSKAWSALDSLLCFPIRLCFAPLFGLQFQSSF